MLEMEHVTFRYSKETPVILSDVSVSFGKGEFIAVTGRKRQRKDNGNETPYRIGKTYGGSNYL